MFFEMADVCWVLFVYSVEIGVSYMGFVRLSDSVFDVSISCGLHEWRLAACCWLLAGRSVVGRFQVPCRLLLADISLRCLLVIQLCWQRCYIL